MNYYDKNGKELKIGTMVFSRTKHIGEIIRYDIDDTDKDGEILVAYDIYYDELVKYVFDLFTKRFNSNKGAIDHPIDIVLSGGTASPKGFDKKVRRVLFKMNLPFEIGDIKMAGGGETKKMLQAVAKGCYIRAKQAAKKASVKEEIHELK